MRIILNNFSNINSKNMKKVLSISILVLSLTVILTGCGTKAMSPNEYSYLETYTEDVAESSVIL